MRVSDFTAVLMCDTVRKEVSGKDIIVGTYGGDIMVPDFPGVLEIAIWMEINVPTAGGQEVEIRITAPSVPALSLKFSIATEQPGPMSMFTPTMQVPLQHEGEILVELRQGDSWTALKRKKVMRGEVTQPGRLTSNVSAPPSAQSPPAAPAS